MRHREVILVVDFSNQVYKATAAHQGLTSGTTFTGGIYGFLIALWKAIEATGADRVVVAGDAKPYIRADEYPEYKSDRNKQMTEQDELMLMAYKQSARIVTELCDCMNMPVWRLPGFEYDDLVAHVVSKYRSRFAAIVALTNDSDLYQLFEASNFYIYRGKKGAYTKRDFLEEWGGISPADFVDALSLTGTHNAIKGIKGVGPKTAIKAIKDPSKWEALYQEHRRMVDRNRSLIVLPHPKFPYGEELPTKITMRDPARALYKFCSQYDIEVPLGMANAFEQVLK